MNECKSLDMKYLDFYEGGVRIKMERNGLCYLQKFPFKSFGGKEKTLQVAREIRDLRHIELFDAPVTERFYHTQPKRSLAKSLAEDLDYPPLTKAGLSYGISRGKVLYIVVSHNFEKNTPSRIRFNIKKLGYETALEMATAKLDELRSSIQ